MNLEAAGLGSWLLRETLRPVSASLEDAALLDCESYARWQVSQGGNEEISVRPREALPALLRELWRDELSAGERAVLRGLHLEGKNEAALARELGLHHSAVARTRRRAEEKLRGGIGYALRYIALLERTGVAMTE